MDTHFTDRDLSARAQQDNFSVTVEAVLLSPTKDLVHRWEYTGAVQTSMGWDYVISIIRWSY